MATVDKKGRIVIPNDIRERLGLRAGTDVDVHTARGSVVIVPAEDTAQYISDHVALIQDIAAERDNRHADRDDSNLILDDDPIAAHHREVIARRAQSSDSDDSVENK